VINENYAESVHWLGTDSTLMYNILYIKYNFIFSNCVPFIYFGNVLLCCVCLFSAYGTLHSLPFQVDVYLTVFSSWNIFLSLVLYWAANASPSPHRRIPPVPTL